MSSMAEAQAVVISRRAELQDCDPSFFKGKVVLVRVDYNVPVSAAPSMSNDSRHSSAHHTWIVSDDSKIKASLASINFLINAGAKVVLVSHMGRPPADMMNMPSSERLMTKFSLHHVLYKLVNHLGSFVGSVVFSRDCVGPKRDEMITSMHEGDVLLLENTRFHSILEENNDPAFAMALASKCDIFVMDAFASSHRAHASVLGVKPYMSSKVALLGLAAQHECDGLNRCISSPTRPFAAVIGGAKMSSKLPVIRSLLKSKSVDKLIIGGAMAHTFLLAKGVAVGASLVEDSEEMLVLARTIMRECTEAGISLLLPMDFVLQLKGAADEDPMLELPRKRPEAVTTIPEPDGVAMDIGPLSMRAMIASLQDCKTILWNGPLGYCEMPRYAWSTNALIDWMSARGNTVTTVVAGGDTVAAAERCLHIAARSSVTNAAGRANVGPSSGHPCRLPHDKEHSSPFGGHFSHLSLAGGAALEFLKGRRMPGLEVVSFLSELPHSALSDAALAEVERGAGGEGASMKAASAIERHAHHQTDMAMSPPVSLVPCDVRDSSPGKEGGGVRGNGGA